jgi:hypothetical protein
MIYMDRLEKSARSATIPVKRPPMDTRRARSYMRFGVLSLFPGIWIVNRL